MRGGVPFVTVALAFLAAGPPALPARTVPSRPHAGRVARAVPSPYARQVHGLQVAVPAEPTGSLQLGAEGSAVRALQRALARFYLWGGTSGFGYDCSGLTYAVYHADGLTISRDADQQAVHGTSVARSHLQPADLVFFRASPSGPISHVGLYLRDGSMIDAPHTGAVIRIDRVSSFPYYAGARRYLQVTDPRGGRPRVRSHRRQPGRVGTRASSPRRMPGPAAPSG